MSTAFTTSTPLAKPTWESSFNGNLSLSEFTKRWTTRLDECKATLQKLESDTATPTRSNFLKPLDEIFGKVTFSEGSFAYKECHPDEALRADAARCDNEFAAFAGEMGRSVPLLQRALLVDSSKLDPVASRFLLHLVRDLKRSGAGLPESTQAEIQAIEVRISALLTEFKKNIQEDVREMSVDKADLVGLPVDFWATHPAGPAGKVKLTTASPDREAIGAFCENRDVRRAHYLLCYNIAHPTNDPILRELVQLRGKVARLRGYKDHTGYHLETLMAETPKAVATFLNGVRAQCWGPAKAEEAMLHSLMVKLGQMVPGDELHYYDYTFARQMVTQQLSGYNSKEIRRYFPADATIRNIYNLAESLFQIKFVKVAVPAWHEAVVVHDVYDLDNHSKPIGRLYSELHPRPMKNGHCWSNALVGGVHGTVPVRLLLTNIAGGPDAYTSFKEGTTLWHELGHCLHAFFAGEREMEWNSFTGTLTQRDFTETPSQLLEEWLLSMDVLKTVAKDREGRPMPDDMIRGLINDNKFGNAYEWQQQTFFAKQSLELFLHPGNDNNPLDLAKLSANLAQEWQVPSFETEAHHPSSFPHLATPGYGPAYYSYVWSRVICRDILTAFDPQNLMDPKVARRYRETILAPGGTRDPKVLIEEFLGRPFNDVAFGKWVADTPALL